MKRLTQYLLFALCAACMTCKEGTNRVEARAHTLGFQPAFERLPSCQGTCREYQILTGLGDTVTLHAPASPTLAISSRHLRRAEALSVARAPQLLLLLDNEAERELAKWREVNAAQITDHVLVTLDDEGIGAIDGAVFAATDGMFILRVSTEQLAAVRSRLKLMERGELSVSAEEQDSACLRIAQGNQELLQHCRDLGSIDFVKEKAALDRAEAELDSPNPDYEAALRDLGVDVDDSATGGSPGARPGTNR